eukprot:scpid7959/ scgid31452/ 
MATGLQQSQAETLGSSCFPAARGATDIQTHRCQPDVCDNRSFETETRKDEGQLSHQEKKTASCRKASKHGCNRRTHHRSHNEYLVLKFVVNHDLLPLTYCILVMVVLAVSAENADGIQPIQIENGMLTLTVPHNNGLTRMIRLRSTCTERVTRAALDETWPIDPSWSFTPLVFESPMNSINGSGDIQVYVDNEEVATARFNVNNDTMWRTRRRRNGQSDELCYTGLANPWRQLRLIQPKFLVFHITRLEGVVHTLMDSLAREYSRNRDTSVATCLVEGMALIQDLTTRISRSDCPRPAEREVIQETKSEVKKNTFPHKHVANLWSLLLDGTAASLNMSY